MSSESQKQRVYLPVMLDITAKSVLLVGAGRACAEKLRTLSQLSIPLTVIAPQIDEAFLGKPWIDIIERPYQRGDAKGYDVVYIGVNDPELTQKIREEAAAQGALVNVVDNPALSDYISPSLIQRPSFALFISTFGRGPGATKKIRQTIEEALDLDELEEFVKTYVQERDLKKREEQGKRG